MSTSQFVRTITLFSAAACYFIGNISPASAASDAKATKLLNSVLIAHKQIREMTCTVKLREQDAKETDAATVAFAYRKPDFAKVTMMVPSGTVMRCTSNGKQILLYSPQEKKYVHQSIATGHSGASAIATVSESKILKSYVRPQALLDSLEGANVSTRYAGTSTVEGVAVDLVSASLPAPKGGSLSVTCGFGCKDHILRSIAITTTDAGGNSTRIDEVVSKLSLSPRLTSADFEVSTPKDATLVTPDADSGLYDPRLKPGATPIPIDATDLSGRKVSLGEYRGKVLLIDFWATWCGPCMMEMPNVQAVYKKYHSRGLEVVGFSQDQDEGQLKSVLAERGIPWRQVFCGAPGADSVPVAYGIQAIPFMVLVGRDGKIAAVDMRGPELEEAVASAIAK